MNYKSKLNEIKAIVLDVDGVLTDGNLILMPDGSMTRSMNTRDGYVMQLAIKLGFPIAVITGGKDKMVKERLRYLGITDVYLGSSDKEDDLDDFVHKYGISLDEVLYMGDDIPDLGVMKLVGLPCCPKNAVPEIRDIALYVSQVEGGKGCVRDVIEQLLKVQGKWEVNTSITSA